MTQDHRICFIGDSYVAGTTDSEYLGWTGRLCSRALRRASDSDFELSAYNLGIRSNTSRDVLARWRDECTRRLNVPNTHGYVVLSVGINDTTIIDGRQRVATDETLNNFAQIVQDASEMWQIIAIGPALMASSTFAAQNERIAQLCHSLQSVSRDLQVPYLPLAATLAQQPDWQSELALGDGSHPNAAGYTRLADIIDQWPCWWFGASASSHPSTFSPK